MNVTIIDLHQIQIECCICGESDIGRWGMAVYAGQIVPDDYQGEWGGAPACKRCYDAWTAGIIKPWMTFSEARKAVEQLLSKSESGNNLGVPESLLSMTSQEMNIANARQNLPQPALEAKSKTTDTTTTNAHTANVGNMGEVKAVDHMDIVDPTDHQILEHLDHASPKSPIYKVRRLGSNQWEVYSLVNIFYSMIYASEKEANRIAGNLNVEAKAVGQ